MEHVSKWSVLTILMCWAERNAMRNTETLLEASGQAGLEAKKSQKKQRNQSMWLYFASRRRSKA